MSEWVELMRRTERIESQLEALCGELRQLRESLHLMQAQQTGNGQAQTSCLAVALSLAQDLGGAFSSENPHELSGRGDSWF